MAEKPDPAHLLAEQKTKAWIDLVYASAMRRLRDDADRAADVTQAVMLVMLRKAKEGKLPPEKYMAGWLIKITGYAVMQMNRAAARRSRHESQAARTMPRQSAQGALHSDIRDALDESLLKLNRIDREAIVRRCLQGQSLAEIGQALGINQNTVGKRISRAIPKLRSLLLRRGITAPTAAVATVLAAEQLIKAPAIAMTPSIAPAITATPTTALTNLIWPSTQPTISVTRIIDGPSNAILNQLLTGLKENQSKRPPSTAP